MLYVAVLEYQTSTYLTVIWCSLNSNILLRSHFIPPPTLSHMSDLVSLLQGHDPGSRSQSSAVARQEVLGNVLQSANQCAEKRFLVVLDCYQATSEYTEIIVRRAVPETERDVSVRRF